MSTSLKNELEPKMKWEIDNSWTLFLDRDGVINERIFSGYVQKPDEFVLRNDFGKIAAFLAQKFQLILVVTNQQGIAKGLMSERNLFDVHDYMIGQIEKVKGRVDHIYFASNAKGDILDRRKPNPAMAMEAKVSFPQIDFNKSIMIGDTDSDIRFGQELGMKTVLLRSKEKVSVQADLEIDSLEELKFVIE